MRALLQTILSEREAWKRFFFALGGLTLAFLAAVYSTVTRQAGDVLATLLLASLALLLAGIVGLVTVPYLARRVAIARLRDVIDFELTRGGMAYLGLVLVIAIAALNTGNNLLFIVVAAMLAAIVISGLASLSVLRGLELEVILPANVFARTPVEARLALKNQRHLLPSFSIAITRPKARGGRRLRVRRTVFHFPWWRPPEEQWFNMPDLDMHMEDKVPATDEPIFPGTVYFPYLPAHSTTSAGVQLNFPHRGRYRQEAFALATRFPFAFLKKTRRLELVRELIVYPPVDALETSLEVLPVIAGEREAFVRGRGYDLYRIREYQPQDPRRHVDWKATAKTGELKVREYAREEEPKLRIVFDNPAPGELSESQYERQITLAASLAWHFMAEDADLSFAALGYSGSPDIYDFLRHLALVQPLAGNSILEELPVTGEFNLIVTARSRDSIPTALWACSHLVFMET
jgi:uncharacterized protein (DUF58 family)